MRQELFNEKNDRLKADKSWKAHAESIGQVYELNMNSGEEWIHVPLTFRDWIVRVDNKEQGAESIWSECKG